MSKNSFSRHSKYCCYSSFIKQLTTSNTPRSHEVLVNSSEPSPQLAKAGVYKTRLASEVTWCTSCMRLIIASPGHRKQRLVELNCSCEQLFSSPECRVRTGKFLRSISPRLEELFLKKQSLYSMLLLSIPFVAQQRCVVSRETHWPSTDLYFAQ